MDRRLALVAALLLAGCARPEPPPPPEVEGPAWLPRDTWTFEQWIGGRLHLDAWEVQARHELDGRPTLRVVSRTSGPVVNATETGWFAEDTLGLVRLAGGGLVRTYDPAETPLLPPGNRTVEVRVAQTGPEGAAAWNATVHVRHAGIETVVTSAGAFAAHRFDVRRAAVVDGEPREDASVIWWSPVTVSVVREESDGEVTRMLSHYVLAPGARAAPPGS